MRLLREYQPAHKGSWLKYDFQRARSDFYASKPKTLHFLLRNRFHWMNDYIKEGDMVLEVGCGIGVSRDFLRKDATIVLTDVSPHPWIDREVDATKTPFERHSFDVVFCSNMIHHLPFPALFFEETSRILKPGGYLLVQEVNCSILMRLLLRLLRHEGWSFDVDPYDPRKPVKDETNPWAGNNAIPNLLFDDLVGFAQNFPMFSMHDHAFSECFVFLLSGGVTAKIRTIPVPLPFLRVAKALDDAVVFIAPNIFGLQRRIVLRKEIG